MTELFSSPTRLSLPLRSRERAPGAGRLAGEGKGISSPGRGQMSTPKKMERKVIGRRQNCGDLF